VPNRCRKEWRRQIEIETNQQNWVVRGGKPGVEGSPSAVFVVLVGRVDANGMTRSSKKLLYFLEERSSTSSKGRVECVPYKCAAAGGHHKAISTVLNVRAPKDRILAEEANRESLAHEEPFV
jgi:alkylation response protein AidB-like acyl-CoA dehydrogenase